MATPPADRPARSLTAVVQTLLLVAVVLTGGMMGAAAQRTMGAEGATEVESLALEATLCEHARKGHARRARAPQPPLPTTAPSAVVARRAVAVAPTIGAASEHASRNGIGAPLRC